MKTCATCGCPETDHKEGRACTVDCPVQCSEYVEKQGISRYQSPLTFDGEADFHERVEAKIAEPKPLTTALMKLVESIARQQPTVDELFEQQPPYIRGVPAYSCRVCGSHIVPQLLKPRNQDLHQHLAWHLALQDPMFMQFWRELRQ